MGAAAQAAAAGEDKEQQSVEEEGSHIPQSSIWAPAQAAGVVTQTCIVAE